MGNIFKIAKTWNKKQFTTYCDFCAESKKILYSVYKEMTRAERDSTFNRDRIFKNNLTKKAYHKYWFCSEECMNCYVLKNG